MNPQPDSADFGARLPAYLERLERALDRCLPAEQTDPARLHRAMRYACAGGKRLRALLVYAAGQTLGLAPEALDPAACAVELIHAYSLVHDDLPAMDDDALRRGRPTVHVAFDEATAILVGDALQALAFEVLAQDTPQVCSERRVRMLAILARAAGSQGMVGGQAVDIESEGRQIGQARLESLHERKTGALLLACCRLAAAAAGADSSIEAALAACGRCLGLAFQVQDDVLDLTADTAVLGKTAGKDAAQEKSTFPALLGVDGARDYAQMLFDRARAALVPLGARAAPLLWLVGHIEQRRF
jgi:farnesyl diphosphate synthase